jgi:hypothetical protein
MAVWSLLVVSALFPSGLNRVEVKSAVCVSSEVLFGTRTRLEVILFTASSQTFALSSLLPVRMRRSSALNIADVIASSCLRMAGWRLDAGALRFQRSPSLIFEAGLLPIASS